MRYCERYWVVYTWATARPIERARKGYRLSKGEQQIVYINAPLRIGMVAITSLSISSSPSSPSQQYRGRAKFEPSC
jgi:hypothetical protein